MFFVSGELPTAPYNVRNLATLSPVISFAVTAEYETPSPIDLGPSVAFDQPTGWLVVLESPGRVIPEAKPFLEAAAAVLPVSEKAEAITDSLMRAAIGKVSTHPLKKDRNG